MSLPKRDRRQVVRLEMRVSRPGEKHEDEGRMREIRSRDEPSEKKAGGSADFYLNATRCRTRVFAIYCPVRARGRNEGKEKCRRKHTHSISSALPKTSDRDIGRLRPAGMSARRQTGRVFPLCAVYGALSAPFNSASHARGFGLTPGEKNWRPVMSRAPSGAFATH